MQATKRGFTLIELLVVIAIIGILAAVVLASLNQARDKGNDAAVKSQLGQLRSEMEIYYSDNNSYGSATDCTTAAFAEASAIIDGIEENAASGPDCDSTDSSWAAAAELNDPADTTLSYWCVDSTGAAEAVASGSLSSGNVCSDL